MKEMMSVLLPDSIVFFVYLFFSQYLSSIFNYPKGCCFDVNKAPPRTYVRERESGINIYGKCWCVGISHYYGCNSSSVCNQSLWGNLSSLCSLMLLLYQTLGDGFSTLQMEMGPLFYSTCPVVAVSSITSVFYIRGFCCSSSCKKLNGL